MPGKQETLFEQMFQTKPIFERIGTKVDRDMVFIKIPHLDVEFTPFNDVNKFAELSEMLYKTRGNGNNAAPVLVLQELSKVHKRRIEKVQILFSAVLEAAFAYKRPEDITTVPQISSIFPAESLSRWRKWKIYLKRFIKDHRKSVLEIKEYQEKCWKSRDKVKKYANMLEAARSSLPNYEDDVNEYNARCKAMKSIESELKIRQKKHIINLNQYQKLLTTEHAVRQHIVHLANSLEIEIKACMIKYLEAGVNFLLAASNLTQSSLNLYLEKICDSLYAVSCKNYFYYPPPTDVSSPEFNIAVDLPKIGDTNHNVGDMDSTYASPNYYCTVVEDVEKISDYYLSLKVGDKVKIKMVSRDTMAGFGWTRPTKLSLKKWGFFLMKNIQLYSVLINGN